MLHAAFGTPEPLTPGSEAEAWRSALRPALRSRRTLEEFRRHAPRPPDSRQRLSALMAGYSDAGDDRARALLVDWMTGLQPLGAPPWPLSGTAGPASRPQFPALRHAVRHARPDKRHRYTDVLGRLGASDGGPPAR
ncbi:hypothetical protein ACIREO_13990 [Streptomyces sp. NPDC102441]|uniref:hypothetical protein n=1 Tax=Streptomyces sp. NPDC102441 TaxID=3366176 RepID=UPI003821F6C0